MFRVLPLKASPPAEVLPPMSSLAPNVGFPLMVMVLPVAEAEPKTLLAYPPITFPSI